MIIGLTGQSGSGKTTVSRMIENLGYSVIICDDVAREVTTSKSECNALLAEEFGADIINDDETLNRAKLGQIVFDDRNKLDRLNELIFPFICRRVEEIIAQQSGEHIFLDAPTLFESGLNRRCSCIIGVVGDDCSIINRICQRDNITLEQAKSRITSQNSKQHFVECCDYIIYNEGTIDELEQHTLKLIDKLGL